MNRSDFWWDTGWTAGLLALSGLVWWAVEQLPPPIFDPVGSAALPKVTVVVIAALSVAMGAAAWRSRHAPPKPASAPDQEGGGRPIYGMQMLALLIAYALLLPLLGFAAATFLFVLAGGVILARGDRKAMLASLVSAVLLSVGCQYLFTDIFYIDLP
ncbi:MULTISPECIES: tripartite tricarboxylate transporter TctB family protein [Chelativorans]|uniref:Tripartite tricarboxylate transporter TctB family protein n=1 Tax=Chelativorans intermedius TaxID=515947 RepID=A0ABV6DDB3_9HYPH|nr:MULTISPECIES: tripartite tricarboxylate transporter TctB family protein [Chelativorans]MCT9000570.1 tripartite tricarboxylate transporter TctB family protein [Chelativorans intermedius]WEX12186.1 tripartite tricarboxylate transporter TctB family protein [Chelativorans sp. AA-79]